MSEKERPGVMIDRIPHQSVGSILVDTSVIKSDLNVMKSNYVTREYLEQRFREQNRNLIAIIVAAAGVVGPFLTWLLQHYKP